MSILTIDQIHAFVAAYQDGKYVDLPAFIRGIEDAVLSGQPTVMQSLEQAVLLTAQVDALLGHCADQECHTCGTIMCPHREPLHFHRDGCPQCDRDFGQPEAVPAERAQ